MSDIRNSCILIIDDTPKNIQVLGTILKREDYQISFAQSGQQAVDMLPQLRPDLILLDIMMPGLDGYETCQLIKKDPLNTDVPIIFLSALSEVENKVKAFSIGGVDYVTKPFIGEEVLARVETHLQISHLARELKESNATLQKTIDAFQREKRKREQAEKALRSADERISILSEQEKERWGIANFMGKSRAMAKIIRDIRKLHKADSSSVLVLGESGTGKELIARAIHFGGKRAKGAFIPVNCCSIPADLFESTCFGHVQGAFTGATSNRKGLFECADGGTIFLDEIGDMPYEMQAKLLRVLEDGKITPVGSSKSKKVDIRIVAATHADIEDKIEEGRFRQDLYFRLSSFLIELPALRERKEDISLLVSHFLDTLSEKMGRKSPQMTPQAIQTLKDYSFPGNIRELRNIVENALIRSESEWIDEEDLTLRGSRKHSSKAKRQVPEESFSEREDLDEKLILEYVEKHGSINNTQCRKLLEADLNRASYLLKKMAKEDILVKEGERRWTKYCLSS